MSKQAVFCWLAAIFRPSFLSLALWLLLPPSLSTRASVEPPTTATATTTTTTTTSPTPTASTHALLDVPCCLRPPSDAVRSRFVFRSVLRSSEPPYVAVLAFSYLLQGEHGRRVPFLSGHPRPGHPLPAERPGPAAPPAARTAATAAVMAPCAPSPPPRHPQRLSVPVPRDIFVPARPLLFGLFSRTTGAAFFG